MLRLLPLYAVVLSTLAVTTAQAAAGCETSTVCEDFSDYDIGTFEPLRLSAEQDPRTHVLWSSSGTSNRIQSSAEQGKYLLLATESSGTLLQARPATRMVIDINNQRAEHDALVKLGFNSSDDNFAPVTVISTVLTLSATESNISFGFYGHTVEIEGVGPNQYRVYAIGIDETYNEIRSDGLPVSISNNADLIAIKTTTDFENLTQSVFANGALVAQWSVPDIFAGLEDQYSWAQEWEIYSGINFYNTALRLSVDDIAFEGVYPEPDEPAIEPSLSVSQDRTQVGDRLFFTVTADMDTDWTLYLGETDDLTQTERTVSSDDFDAAVAIPVEYYKAAGAVEPRLNIDGRDIRLESPISVSCYVEASAYSLSSLRSATDCDGDGFTNQDEITGSGAVAIIDASQDGLNAFRPDLIVEIDTVGLPSDRTASYYESLFSDVISPFANNPEGEVNLVIKASENFTQSEMISRCDNGGCVNSNSEKIGTFRFGFPRGRCEGSWGNDAQRQRFNTAGSCGSAEEAYRKHVKQLFMADSTTITSAPPLASPEDSVMYIGVNTSTVGDIYYKLFNKTYFTRTFMHELGHTLGLRHGGSDSYNFKPNYLSLMNYRFQMLTYSKNAPLDYSHSKLNTLNANAMCEKAGTFCSTGSLRAENGFVDHRYEIVTSSLEIPLIDLDLPNALQITSKPSTSSEFDWNNNGDIDDIAVAYNPPLKGAGYTDEDRNENNKKILEDLNGQMTGHDDWAALVFDPDLAQAVFGSGLSFAEATTILVEEISIDHDEDNIASGVDNCPTIPNQTQADSDNDGLGDACDLCPAIPASEHVDIDRDGIGDACDAIIGSTPIDIPNDEWVQIGTPVATLAQGLGRILASALDPENYGIDWIVYGYEAQTRQYTEIKPGDTLESGVGYWLKQITGRSVTASTPVWLSHPTSSIAASCPEDVPCVVSSVTELASAPSTNWLMIANPFDRAILVSDLFVSLRQNGSTKVFSPGAAANDTSEFTNGIYTYNDSINDYEFFGPDQLLEPWQAGWFGYLATEGSASSTYIGFSDRP